MCQKLLRTFMVTICILLPIQFVLAKRISFMKLHMQNHTALLRYSQRTTSSVSHIIFAAKFVDKQVPFTCLYFFRSFAKKPSASFKISLAFLSYAFSRSSSLIRLSASESESFGRLNAAFLSFRQSASV